MDTYTCTMCGRSITEVESFVRSVNLQTVAWCRPCWFAKNADRLPQQREPSSTTKEEPRRRWLPRRRDSSYDGALDR
jgi:hypothetical protein